MLRFGKEFGCTPPRERVSWLMYNLALSTLCEHLVIPSASNSHFKPRQLVECLLYLSVEGRYAESGLEDLACTREAPSADTLLYRLKKVEGQDAYEMLIQANDSIIEELRSKGVFRRPVVAAIDYTEEPYYGEYNSLLRRGRWERGTDLHYTYASLHIVEAGRRITVYTTPVYQLEDQASIVEELVEAAGERGVRIQTLLLDRGFYTTNTINTLNRLRVKYIMPAVKNSRVKKIIEDYHNHLTPNTIKHTLIRDDGEEASFNLTIHPKKGAKETEPIHERYIASATNMNHKEVFKLYPNIPEEYRKRWGIETGFRVQNTIKAKTTSPNYTIRLIYHLLSIILYNIWILANITLLQQLKKELTKPIIKLTHLTRAFRLKIELNKPP